MADVVATSEVNPVDFFVEGKLSFPSLFYKLCCGAIVTIIALRFNGVLENVTKEVTSHFTITNLLLHSLIDVAIVVVILIIFAIIVRLSYKPLNEVFK